MRKMKTGKAHGQTKIIYKVNWGHQPTNGQDKQLPIHVNFLVVPTVERPARGGWDASWYASD